jgi:beta-lactamase class A
VAIRNLKDGQTVSVNPDQPFPAASLYKLLVMYRVYQLIERGDLSKESEITFQPEDMVEAENGDGLSPGDVITVGEAVEWMITFSSNPASYALARAVGGWDQVATAASELGMNSTEYDGQYFVTTPADMMRFFELLGSGSMVSPKASQEMIDVLLRQQINDRIPADLPAGTKVAHKTGELPEVRNDAGIVFTDNGPLAIVIMGEGIDPPKAAEAQATIARLAFDRLGT